MKRVTKIIIIISSVLLIGLGGYWFVLKMSQKKPAANAPSGTSTISPGFTVPLEGDRKMNVKIQDESGKYSSELEVNNLYENPVEKLPGEIVDFRSTDDYLMEFQPAYQQFVIAIQNPEDIYGARTRAESDFLESLSIDREKACELNVTLSVPVQVNEKNAGKNFGLSFCPNGKPFE
ncbi:MAG: hypothetical protein A2Z52_01200 [Candidatus Moranbacteria bacterium RBG_19FT_COMBO_42_6]|nr:MAG: hypothetical protein A2Z52_01200 [Candidatus Moranbacteria bacterium RBG_19FT_COMBO_42_6]